MTARLIPNDEIVFHLADGSSAGAVCALPCERVIESLWIAPNRPTEKEFR
jgi:hypothetical protein